jgi:hypothetical protein
MKFLLSLLFVLSLSVPALAEDGTVISVSPTRVDGCYTQDEAVAEQGIRIHSELMVIALNCQHLTPAGQENLYQSYREMTSRNADLFSGYENTLIDYFRRTGSGSPEGQLNILRTQLANKISLDAARTRPDVFCSHYMPRIEKAAAMTRGQINKWASTFYPGHPASHPVCTKVAQSQ